jgi:hypothetical protein
VPCAASTRRTRLREVRRVHRDVRAHLSVPEAAQAHAWREGEGWASVPETLAQIPTLRFPTGLHGRRDAWLVVLVGFVSLTRKQATEITADQVRLHPLLEVACARVPFVVPAAECPACAVTRWLRVLGASQVGGGGAVREMLDPRGADLELHDCGRGLDGAWRQVATLLPAIDKHGWVADQALHRQTITDLLRYRQTISGLPAEVATATRVATGRFADASRQQLADAYDEVDQALADLLAKTEELLAGGREVRDRLNSFGRRA